MRIAEAQGRLRYVHLSYHLQMRELLSSQQLVRYDEVRGRSSSASSYWSSSQSRTIAGATQGTPRIWPSAIGWNTWQT
jgi:hypothetical protein